MESEPSATLALPSVDPYAFLRSLRAITGVEPNNLMEVLSRMIHGSNMISMAGGSLSTTYRLCFAVFEEREVPEEISENDFEYNEIREHMEFRKIPVSHESILRCYRETVQHAEAAKYLIKKIVLGRQPFDEATFQEAHRILTHKIDLNPQMPWNAYGGYYRPCDAPRYLQFLDPTQIPTAMLSMFNELAMEMFTLDTKQLREEDVLERISYACRFSGRLILIHPFLDGNGRMYRLFLTTLLLRAGICPAVYGLYALDRFRHSQAELSCYMKGNQEMLGVQDAIPLATNPHLVKFVVEHMHYRWKTPGHHMWTFLQVTGQAPYDPNAPNMGPQ